MTSFPKRRLTVAPPPQLRSAPEPGEPAIPPGDVAEVTALLHDASLRLHALLQDETFMPETPLEVQSAIASSVHSLDAALGRLASLAPPPAGPRPGGPTHRQGQFLAFIREYILRNQAGVAPSHADFQRFFNLTPPSVNSMLIRLEQRRFIRRIPGQARAIEITCPPDWIPPLGPAPGHFSL